MTDETNIDKPKKKRIVSDETKKKLSEAKKGNEYWKDKLHTEEEKKKISEAMKGRTLSEETKKKISNSCKGHIATEETKQKYRESAIKYMKTTGFTCPRIGKNEKQILDKLESLFGYKIIRQYPVTGYFIDGYITEINLAIEVDEEYHKDQKEKDIKREEFIIKQLGCTFYRIKDSDLEIADILSLYLIICSMVFNKSKSKIGEQYLVRI